MKRVARLEQHGFVHQAEVEAGTPARQIVEIHPHPALIALFNLETPLRYKSRPNHSLADRLNSFRRYQTLLRSLETATPAFTGADELLMQPLDTLGPAPLKRYEDQLDGVTCAYIAHYLWCWGMARARVFGNMERGYITTPVPIRDKR